MNDGGGEFGVFYDMKNAERASKKKKKKENRQQHVFVWLALH